MTHDMSRRGQEYHLHVDYFFQHDEALIHPPRRGVGDVLLTLSSEMGVHHKLKWDVDRKSLQYNLQLELLGVVTPKLEESQPIEQLVFF